MMTACAAAYWAAVVCIRRACTACMSVQKQG